MSEKTSKNNIVLVGAGLLVGILLGVGGTWVVKGGGASGPDPKVAEFNGRSLRASEVFSGIKTRLFEIEEDLYRTKEQAINEFIEQKLMEAESTKQNLPIEKIVEKEMGTQEAEVTDKEIEEFLKSKGISLSDNRIKKDDVKEFLNYQKKFQKRQTYVNKLKEKANVKLFITEPQSPKINVVSDGFPAWGNSKAPVTIIEFSDFQCPFCSRAVEPINRIKQEYGPDKVRIVFMDMPLPNHPRAVPASLAAHCANEQGKFWEYHNALFQNQSKLEDSDLKDHAKALALDLQKFSTCFDQKKYVDSLERSRKEAEKAGIQATPSFIINGALVQGAQPFERFKEKIDKALK